MTERLWLQLVRLTVRERGRNVSELMSVWRDKRKILEYGHNPAAPMQWAAQDPSMEIVTSSQHGDIVIRTTAKSVSELKLVVNGVMIRLETEWGPRKEQVEA